MAQVKMKVIDYPEEDALKIYTDGSMLPGPRRGDCAGRLRPLFLRLSFRAICKRSPIACGVPALDEEQEVD